MIPQYIVFEQFTPRSNLTAATLSSCTSSRMSLLEHCSVIKDSYQETLHTRHSSHYHQSHRQTAAAKHHSLTPCFTQRPCAQTRVWFLLLCAAHRLWSSAASANSTWALMPTQMWRQAAPWHQPTCECRHLPSFRPGFMPACLPTILPSPSLQGGTCPSTVKRTSLLISNFESKEGQCRRTRVCLAFQHSGIEPPAPPPSPT